MLVLEHIMQQELTNGQKIIHGLKMEDVIIENGHLMQLKQKQVDLFIKEILC